MQRSPALAGVLCALVAPFLSGGVSRPDELDLPVIGLALAVLVAGALVRVRPRAVPVVVTLLVVGGVGAFVAYDLSSGVSGPRTVLLGVGLVGLLVGTFAPARISEWPAGVAAGVVVLALGVLAVTEPNLVQVRSDVGAPYTEPAEPTPDLPKNVKWTWTPPDDGVAEIVPTAHGVAVATWDGAVVGLDGKNGTQRWRYARPGASVGVVKSSPDGRVVLVSFGWRHDTRMKLVVALDGDTGRPRFEKIIRDTLADSGEIEPGFTTWAFREGREDYTFVGYDLETGDERWRWHAPEGCESPYTLRAPAREVVLVPIVCDDRTALAGLDEKTGRERWRHEVASGSKNHGSPILVSDRVDGRTVRLHFQVDNPAGKVTSGEFDTATGRLLHADTDAESDRPTSACPQSRLVIATATGTGEACYEDVSPAVTIVSDKGKATVEAPRTQSAKGDLLVAAAPGAFVITHQDYEDNRSPVTGFGG
ncbi:PQQ-binding-like beta-propeller repeat protein [Actinosynnema sp. NPDC020468]|uniref:outer membrane protein assembly factor BamB family protein n=1 Tax=Actinosynnema sp. NPDC020468 TaxID=3154488 RepID=UPI0033D2299B